MLPHYMALRHLIVKAIFTDLSHITYHTFVKLKHVSELLKAALNSI